MGFGEADQKLLEPGRSKVMVLVRRICFLLHAAGTTSTKIITFMPAHLDIVSRVRMKAWAAH